MTECSLTLATYSKISIKIVGQFSLKYSKPPVCIIAGKKEKHSKLQLTLAKEIRQYKHLKTHLNLEKSFFKKKEKEVIYILRTLVTINKNSVG